MADKDPFGVKFRRPSDPPKNEGEEGAATPNEERAEKPTAPLARSSTTNTAIRTERPTEPLPGAADRAARPTTQFERKPGQWSGSGHPDDVPSPRAVEAARNAGRVETTPPGAKPPRTPTVPPAPTPPPTVPPMGHRILSAKTDPGMARNLARAEPDRQVSRSTPVAGHAAQRDRDRTEPLVRAEPQTRTEPIVRVDPPSPQPDATRPVPTQPRGTSREAAITSRTTPPTGTPSIGRAPTPHRPASRSTPPAGMPAVEPPPRSSDSNPHLRAASTSAPPPSAGSSGSMRAFGTTPPQSPTPAMTKASSRLGLPVMATPVQVTLFVEPDDPLATTETCMHIYRMTLESAAAIFVIVDVVEPDFHYIKTELDRNVVAIARQVAQAFATNNMMQRRQFLQQTRRLVADAVGLIDFLAERSLEANPTEARAVTAALLAELIALSGPPLRS